MYDERPTYADIGYRALTTPFLHPIWRPGRVCVGCIPAQILARISVRLPRQPKICLFSILLIRKEFLIIHSAALVDCLQDSYEFLTNSYPSQVVSLQYVEGPRGP